MKYILIIVNFLSAELAYCQQVPILNLRYDEDYAVLKNDTSNNWYHAIKYLPLNPTQSSYVSFGGEYRYQLQYTHNDGWGDGPKSKYTAIYNRLLLHSDIHLAKQLRFFSQLASTTVSGSPTPLSIDENRLDVQQAFIDLNLLNRTGNKLVVRIGRQELLYGSQRLVAVREGPNNRLSFDAVKSFYKKKNCQVDLFYAQPVHNKPGVFDDAINKHEKTWSAYVVVNQLPIINNADFYYIGYQNSYAVFNNVSGIEYRHSIGARFWKNNNAFKYDVEALYQFGKLGTAAIDAYTASANVKYALEQLVIKPVIGLKTEIISGDKSETDNRLNTFNPLFPKGAYFGLAALIGPVNLIDVHPSIAIQVNAVISLQAEYDIFWRQSIYDGIYGPNAGLLYPAAPYKHIGNQLGISMEYNPTPSLSISPEFTFFEVGKYLKAVSAGENIVFAAITIQFKY